MKTRLISAFALFDTQRWEQPNFIVPEDANDARISQAICSNTGAFTVYGIADDPDGSPENAVSLVDALRKGRKVNPRKQALLDRFQALGVDFRRGLKCKVSLDALEKLDKLLPGNITPLPVETTAAPPRQLKGRCDYCHSVGVEVKGPAIMREHPKAKWQPEQRRMLCSNCRRCLAGCFKFVKA